MRFFLVILEDGLGNALAVAIHHLLVPLLEGVVRNLTGSGRAVHLDDGDLEIRDLGRGEGE